MSGIYKTAGTTPRERWKNRAQIIAVLILGWGVGGIGLGVVFTSVWHSEVLPLWSKIAFTVGAFLMPSGFVYMTVETVRTLRNDWILYKAKERSR